MKITGRQLLQATVATTMAFTMLLAPLAAATASAAESAKPGPIKNSSASTAGISEQQASPQIQYQIQAKLDTGKMMITGKETVTYRNTSTDGLSEIVFRLFADANRSKETQPQMFARSNEEMAKANPDKKPEDFLGGIDIISVKDAATDARWLRATRSKRSRFSWESAGHRRAGDARTRVQDEDSVRLAAVVLSRRYN